MPTRPLSIISGLILALAVIILSLPTNLRAALDNNLWSLTAAKAAFGDGQPPVQGPLFHPHAHQWLARLALKDGQPQAAIAWLSPLEENSDPFAQDALAQAYVMHGQPLIAIDLWRGIGFSDHLNAAARAAQDVGDLDLALRAYLAAYELEPERFAHALANTLRLRENYLEAANVIIHALTSFPESGQIIRWWELLANIMRAQGDAAVAIGYYQQVTSVKPESGAVAYAIGQLLIRAEQPLQALNWYQTAHEIEPGHLNYQLEYANLLRDTDQFELALVEYVQAIVDHPDAWDPYYHLAWGYWIYDQPEQAVQAIEAALNLNSENRDIYWRAGLMYEELGQVDQALAAYQQVLRLYPDHKNALRAIERLTAED